MSENPLLARALTRFGMNTPNAQRLLTFYEQAFGARVMLRRRQKSNLFAGSTRRMPFSAESTLLSLGDSTLELLEFDVLGRPYPHDLSPYDTRFQHLGIVVTDMQLAMQRLSRTDGWSAISTAGPQTLPGNDGGVIAFKFRDPDGHPLEFLRFGDGNAPLHWQRAIGSDIHRGIDHSALSVADVQRSVRFYESLGLRQANRTVNQGTAQERLDGLVAPVVDVISLAPRRSTPHVELLHYQTTVRPSHAVPAVNDIASTRLVFALEPGSGENEDCLIQDPDGHFLQFE